MGNCHPEKTIVDQRDSSDFCIECLINTPSVLPLVSKQSSGLQRLLLYFVLLKVTAHTTSVRIYGEPYAHKFCTVDFFPSSSNITRSQVQSRVSA